MKKKALSLVLSIAMLMSLVAVPAYATGSEDGAQTVTLGMTVQSGDWEYKEYKGSDSSTYYTVSVYAASEFDTFCMDSGQIVLDFDESVLTLQYAGIGTDDSLKKVYDDDAGDYVDNPITLTFEKPAANTNGYAMLAFAQTGGVSHTIPKNTVLATLRFSVKEGSETCNPQFSFKVTGKNNILGVGTKISHTIIDTATATASVKGVAPTLTSVTLAPVSGTTSTLAKNTDGTYTVTVSGSNKKHYIQATALSAMGNNMIDKLSWALTGPADANVKLAYNKDDDDGVTYPTVEIMDKAANGTYTLTATPKNGEAQGDAISVTIKIVRTASVPTTIEIDNNDVISLTLPGDVDVYAGETESTTNPSVIYARATKAFTATVYDQFGDPMPDAQVKWSFYIDSTKLGTQYRNKTTHDYCPETGHDHGDNCEQYTYINYDAEGTPYGLEISPDGYLLVTNHCKVGTAVVKAACDRGDGSTVYGFCSQEVTVQTKPTLAQVVFVDTTMPSPYTITIPADGAEPNTANFAAVAKDQYGTVLTNRDIDYSVSTGIEGEEVPDGVSISTDGTLTVTNAAKNAISKGSSIWVTVTADAGSRWDSVSVQIKRADSGASSIAVYKNGVEITGDTDTITIPSSDTDTAYVYTAAVLDQYGAVMTDAVNWAVSGSCTDFKYTESKLENKITFYVGNEAVADTEISLTASYGANTAQKNRSITVSLKNIEFSNVQYTVKDDPTYGDQWSDIVTGISGTAKLDGATVSGTFSLGNTGCPNAGEQTWKILFTSADGTTYKNVEVASGTVNVAKKPLTITANDAAITYGEAPTNNGVTYGDFVNNETKDDLGGTLDYEYNYTAGTSGVGSYTITPDGLTSNNYAIEFRTGTLTVTEKNLSACTVENITGTFTYSGNLQTPAVTVKDGDKTLEKGTDYAAAYSYNTNVGTAKVAIAGSGNYTGKVEKTFTITPAPLTIVSATFDDKTYDSTTAASVTGVTFDGLQNGESLDINTDYTAAGAFAQKDVGNGINASVTVSLHTNNKTSNYQLTVITKENAGQANISPATTTLTLTADNAVYTGKPYDASTKITPRSNVTTAPTYTYYNDVDGSCGTDALPSAPKDVGTYWVKGSIAASGNYSAATSDAVKFQITRAPLTVTAINKTITYGDAPDNNGVTCNGFVNSETTTVLGGTLTYSYDYEQYGNVGSYTITPDGLTSNNYDIEFKKGTLTVEQKEVGITWGSGDLTYTGSAQAPAVTVTGAVNNDSVTATVTGAQTNAGTGYTATVTGLSSNNYELPATGLTKDFSIAKATLTNVSAAQTGVLTYNGKAQHATAVFEATTVGENRVTFTYSATNGGTYGTMPAFTNAGTYKVYYKASAANHEDAFGSFDVTIAARPVTVGPKSYTITQGNAIPTFELEWTGVAAGDSLALTVDADLDCYESDGTTAVSTSTATGSYDIRWKNAESAQLTGTNAANYVLTKLATGTLTINARPSSGSSSTTVTVPVSSDSATVNVKAEVTQGNAKVEVSDAQIEQVAADGAGSVTVDVSGLQNVTSATVPSHVVEKTNEAEDTALTVALPTGSVSLDETALESVTEAADGKDVTVSVVAIPTANVSPVVKDIIGMEPTVVAVVDVNITVNGVKKSSFDGGKVTISVPYTPKKGEDTSKLTVWFIRDDGTIESKGGWYDAKNKCFVFETEHLSQYVLLNAPTAFTDVPVEKYFYPAVNWAVANSITGGTTATTFSPYASCTRGQLVTFLWRAAGKPEAKSTVNPFTDVKETSTFYPAILWAAENGIVTGYNDGTFRPGASVTRQQTAAILYRYAKFAKMDVSVGEDTNILSFNDALSVSEYAIPALQWAVGEKVITGNAGNLLPHDTCTRAQIVTMLYRLLAK